MRTKEEKSSMLWCRPSMPNHLLGKIRSVYSTISYACHSQQGSQIIETKRSEVRNTSTTIYWTCQIPKLNPNRITSTSSDFFICTLKYRTNIA
jgi:hypothetical protein